MSDSELPDRSADQQPRLLRVGQTTDGQIVYQPARDEFDMCRRPAFGPMTDEDKAARQEQQHRLEEQEAARRADLAKPPAPPKPQQVDTSDTEHPKPARGRPSAAARAKPDLIEAALVKHHDYQRGGSVMNHQAATYQQLLDLMKNTVSKTAINRFLESKFGKPAYQLYKEACTREEIGLKIAKWRDELPQGFYEKAVEEEVLRQQGRD
jgi:hypothetical protein